MMKSTFFLMIAMLLTACGNSKVNVHAQSDNSHAVPVFSADSAYQYICRQCEFGPRTMNSQAHDLCAGWIAAKFRQFGMEVMLQHADLKGYDGTLLKGTNIIASYRPDHTDRILICAHWDSRPWADNDPNPDNHRKPVMAANDGASGVAVMLEIARLLAADTLDRGVDFICFDAEDWGTPQWAEDNTNDADTWALGAQYWSTHPHRQAYTARFGILLDMVGGQGAKFYQEQVSKHFADNVVKRVWAAARTAGYGSYFPNDEGRAITDDHLPVNQNAGIPCIDIIAYYPDCEQSSFGPTWHTVSDDIEHIDTQTLQAVGQTLVQVLFE